MLRKISVQELRPGMRIVDSGIKNPESLMIYTTPGVIQSEEQIGDIIAEGFKLVYIDEASVSEANRLEAVSTREKKLARAVAGLNLTPENLTPKKELRVEMPRAKALYNQSIDTAHKMFEQLQANKAIKLTTASDMIDNIVDSVLHNSNALVSLSKLQRQDDYTFRHSVNVSTLSVVFGRHLGLEEDMLRDLGLAGFLHDIGKQFLPPNLINRPRGLSPEEFALVQRHVQLGYEQIADNPHISDLAKLGVLDHHERYDGSGYPNHKSGEEISLLGRILAIVDVYDAITSNRNYKEAITPHSALSKVYKMRGSAFFPNLVESFIQAMGIYPAGSLVKLNTGHLGVVLQNASGGGSSMQPVVVLVHPVCGNRKLPKLLDLSKYPDCQIASCEDPSRHCVNCEGVLQTVLGK